MGDSGFGGIGGERAQATLFCDRYSIVVSTERKQMKTLNSIRQRKVFFSDSFEESRHVHGHRVVCLMISAGFSVQIHMFCTFVSELQICMILFFGSSLIFELARKK